MADVEFPQYPEHSCINCGFLGFRLPDLDAFQGYVYKSARAADRKDGVRIPQVDDKNRMVMSGAIMCWRRAVSLNNETHEVMGNPTNPEVGIDQLGAAALIVATRERPECERYQPWVPHWDEARHFEDWRMDRLEEQRRKWQDDMAENQKMWDLKLASDRKGFEITLNEQSTKWQRSVRKETRWWQVLIVVVTLIGIIAAVKCGNDDANSPQSVPRMEETQPSPIG